MNEISLEYLLNSRNWNNEIYDCDIERYLDIKIDFEKRQEFKKRLEELCRK